MEGIVENINKLGIRPCVLIAPLDWGLGHATRCIPIINVLIEHNVKVIIAADGAIAELLKAEFPSIVFLPLHGYNIKYGHSRITFLPGLLAQMPRIIRITWEEKRWLDKIIDDHHIDAVISDNRFGFVSKKIPCIYITHQLFIETGNTLLNKLAQKIHYRFINRFSECWVPDTPGANNLAGKLSHPSVFPAIPVKYTGPLSRFRKNKHPEKKGLLIILSGPEPQRTIFENLLLHQLKNYTKEVVLVRGLPATPDSIKVKSNITVYNHLAAGMLAELIQQSHYIISRSGYSTVMDLVTLQQKAILVPTPGQKEQEYLADYLMNRKIFFSCRQEDLQLEKTIAASDEFEYDAVADKHFRFEETVITGFCNSLIRRTTVML